MEQISMMASQASIFIDNMKQGAPVVQPFPDTDISSNDENGESFSDQIINQGGMMETKPTDSPSSDALKFQTVTENKKRSEDLSPKTDNWFSKMRTVVLQDKEGRTFIARETAPPPLPIPPVMSAPPVQTPDLTPPPPPQPHVTSVPPVQTPDLTTQRQPIKKQETSKRSRPKVCRIEIHVHVVNILIAALYFVPVGL